MKAVVIALALIATGAVLFSATQRNTVDIDELWSAWKLQHNKMYSASEETLRRGIFEANHKKIEAHNADKTQTFTMALNMFADLTGEEFKEATRCMDKTNNPTDMYCPADDNHCPTLPATSETSWDWRTKGAVTAIKNQGQCGSCWAFSTTGALEGLYYLNHNTLLSFSEQQLVDCATSCEACNGCWPNVAMEYSAEKGMIPEALYPYKAVQGTCQYSLINTTYIKTNTGYQCVTAESVPQMQAATVQQPVSIAVEADQNAWQFYSSGTVTSGCGTQLDHAVLIVGYDISDASSGYWIVKNSWGTSWGMNGYIQIGSDPTPNGGYGNCGILRCGVLPTPLN